RGNVLALLRRAEWRGFDVRVEEVSRGDRLPPDARLVVIGGGTDRVQAAVEADLLARRDPLAELTDRGGVVCGVCGCYQVLEGAVQGTVVGTYLHGPVLPLNPMLADLLLERALAPATGGGPLRPLPDDIELAAHEHALKLHR